MVFTWNPDCNVCFIRQMVLTCAGKFYLRVCDGQIVLVHTNRSIAHWSLVMYSGLKMTFGCEDGNGDYLLNP